MIVIAAVLASTVPPAGPAAASAPSLEVSGNVSGLYPGATKRMRVRVRNRHHDPVRLRWVSATSGDARPGCSRRELVVRPSRREPLIEARSARTATIRVRLRRTAPNACQGARWPLRLLARGRVDPAASRPSLPTGPGDRATALPFTGLALPMLAFVGIVLVATGAVVRARTR